MGNALQDTGQLITVDADGPGMGEPEEAPKNPLQAKRRRRAPTKVKRLQDIGVPLKREPCVWGRQRGVPVSRRQAQSSGK